jgi:hypothetical protein
MSIEDTVGTDALQISTSGLCKVDLQVSKCKAHDVESPTDQKCRSTSSPQYVATSGSRTDGWAYTFSFHCGDNCLRSVDLRALPASAAKVINAR